MTDVQQIEAAVREGNRPSRSTIAGDDVEQLLFRENLTQVPTSNLVSCNV